MTENEKPVDDKPTDDKRVDDKPVIERAPRNRMGGKVPSLEHETHYASKAQFKAKDDEIERELQEAMGGLQDAQLYGEPSQSGRRPPAASGSDPARKKGRVVAVHGPDVFVDLPGGRSQGVLPLLQFEGETPAIGTEVEVNIEGYDRANGLVLLTRKGSAVEADWSSIATGMVVEARVTGTNKGGLSVDVDGIRGFLPMGQIDLWRVENADQFVNQKLLCMVTEADRVDKNLVVSRRALLEKEREEAKVKLWQELEEGQVREGIVRSLKDFGAFVDLGGVDGLLHVSEISWTRVPDAAEALQIGQKVKVVVLKIDHERHKVSLGMKQLMTSPWEDAATRFHPGLVVTGKVSRLTDFGAFVELEPGIEGLIHISELAPQRIRRAKDVVQVGQEVQVKVLSVDPTQRRIGLSLKQALAKPEEPAAVEEAEEEVEIKPRRPRTTPLRGGIGDSSLPIEMEE
jgi:ribosomal protein S1